MKCIFSIDVEDWFHILGLPGSPKVADWDSLPSFVEKNFMYLLDIFAEYECWVTCFFLGWVAEKFPHLVRRALEMGHEIASHGYSHELAFDMSREDFYFDAVRAKKILEDITGNEVRGFRVAGFSITRETTWVLDELIKAGYGYSSSLFPGSREHGGLDTGIFSPFFYENSQGRILEIPMTVVRVFGKPVCFFGGGYLRIFPYAVIRRMIRKVLDENRPVVFYVHPREIDTRHPRLAMSVKRRLKSYINIHTAQGKIRKILDEFEVTCFRDFLSGDRTFTRSMPCRKTIY
jgi:polysaccharide deacetylase family protein (PEP-CTERM system associated)